MNVSALKWIQRVCIICFIAAVIVFLAGCAWLVFQRLKSPAELPAPSGEASEESALADEKIRYPSNVRIGSELPELKVFDENGAAVDLSAFRGKNLIIVFWASWCKHCRLDLENAKEYAALTEADPEVEMILINKLDGEKETREQAANYLAENQIPLPNYFDEDLKVYNELGIKVVPTMLGIDSNGVVRAVRPGKIGGAESLKAVIDDVKSGGGDRERPLRVSFSFAGEPAH